MLDKQAKILVVDDMKIIRQSLKNYLKVIGYNNVIEADSGTQALAMHQSEKPAFIFMDLVMPNLNGDEALAAIREIDTDTPIVILTSVASQSSIDYCRGQGILDYIVKPLTVSTGPGKLTEVFSKVGC